MIKPEGKRKVSVEDLLRLKRAERPPSEFWSRFERELRAKQLSALLVRRPWWQRLPNVAPFFVRHRILIGASAVLVGTFFSLHNSRTPVPAAANQPIGADATVVSASAGGLVPTTNADYAFAVVERSMPERVMVEPVGDGDAVAGSGASIAVTPHVASLTAVQSPIISKSAPPDVTPGMPYFVATDLMVPVAVSAALPRAKIAPRVDTHAVATRATVEPLQQMTPPSETRRTRLQTAMVSVTSFESSNRTTERVANRIDDERLYEQVSRFGARGDRLNVKF